MKIPVEIYEELKKVDILELQYQAVSKKQDVEDIELKWIEGTPYVVSVV